MSAGTSSHQLWRATPRGAQRHFVIVRCTDPATGVREYHRGGTGQKVSRFRSQTAAEAVAARLNATAEERNNG